MYVRIMVFLLFAFIGFTILPSLHKNSGIKLIKSTSILGSNQSNPIPQIEQAILMNIFLNGYNNHTGTESGLWINWQYGTNPLQTNFNGSGFTDQQSNQPFRHDPLTDMRYIHTLWLYKSQNPQDTTYDSAITRFTPIVQNEFMGTVNERGWVVDEEFLDLYRLSGDSMYKNIVTTMVAGYSKEIDPAIGIMYKTSLTHPNGYYRPSDVLSAACSMIIAGTQFHNTQWVQQGTTALTFVFNHALLKQYNTFTDQMDNVKNPDGTPNQNEIFYKDVYRNYTINGNATSMGAIAQDVISLLHTYQATQNVDFLTKAEILLMPFTTTTNSLQMWDSTNLGYYQSVAFSGPSQQNPGTFTVNSNYKEAGRQVLMLWAFHLANQLDNNKFSDMESVMKTVATTKAYSVTDHGVYYQVTPNWNPVTLHSGTNKGVVENWVTTEAMGAELESLLSLGSSLTTSPTPSLSPTNPGTKNISLNVTVFLHGIGRSGDNVNPNSIGNLNPTHTSRIAQISIFTPNNTLQQKQQGTITYDKTQGAFTGSITLTGMPSGQYLFAIKTDGFLEKRIENIVTLVEGQAVNLPSVELINGDITNDNTLNILDYNALVSCFGTAQTNPNYHCLYPVTTNTSGADINDDQVVDGVDYNLFLRELSVQVGN